MPRVIKTITAFFTMLLLLWLYMVSPLSSFAKNLDSSISVGLNNLGTFNISVARIWAYLVHDNESWINVIVMILVNLLSILFIKNKAERVRASKLVLVCWVSFQIVLIVNNLFFSKWLSIRRASPSVVDDNIIRLSNLFLNPFFKDGSANSFPAGHSLIFIYWWLFLSRYATKYWLIFGGVMGIVLAMARVASGAHWISDVVFTVVLGYFWFNLVTHFVEGDYGIKKSLY